MRTIASLRKRITLGLLGSAACWAGLWAGDDTPPPPPYPSVSPVLPAVLPPTPPAPDKPKDDVKPVGGQTPVPAPVTPPSIPAPTVPVPKLDVPPVVIPKVETPPFVAPVLPTVPSVKPDTTPVKPADLPPTVSTPKVETPIVPITPVNGNTDPKAKPVTTKPTTPGVVNISLGATPGVLDNVGKFEAMLTESKAAYAKVHDYSCHFIKQERLKGKPTGEVIHELHCRTVPFAAYTKSVMPKEQAGFEMVFVAGKFSMNQVRVKPIGGVYTTMAPDDPRTMSGRHSADQVGIGSVLATLDRIMTTERKLGNPMAVSITDYTYAGKPVARYELLCDKPHAHRYSQRTIVYVDKETKLPVRFEAYDEPRSGDTIGDLLESYSFVNLKLNVGHSAAVFDR